MGCPKLTRGARWSSFSSGRDGPFDLLLTDMKMPKMGGHDLIRRFREKHPTLPVIVLSALVPKDVLEDLRGLGEGQIIHLEKPIIFRQLTDLVAQVPPPHEPASGT